MSAFLFKLNIHLSNFAQKASILLIIRFLLETFHILKCLTQKEKKGLACTLPSDFKYKIREHDYKQKFKEVQADTNSNTNL